MFDISREITTTCYENVVRTVAETMAPKCIYISTALRWSFRHRPIHGAADAGATTQSSLSQLNRRPATQTTGIASRCRHDARFTTDQLTRKQTLDKAVWDRATRRRQLRTRHVGDVVRILRRLTLSQTVSVAQLCLHTRPGSKTSLTHSMHHSFHLISNDASGERYRTDKTG